MAKKRIDKLLVERGLAQSLEQAANLIANGAVSCAGMPATNAKSMVESSAHLVVRDDSDLHYVSRGAHKLIKALDHFAIDPNGLVALDVGASTGGFTDVLLRRGATKVYAIDVGYGQLAWSLRSDSRVVVMDRTNVRELAPDNVPDGADLAVIDVSFIGLAAVLPAVAALLGPTRSAKQIVALIKPQFEVPREQVAPGGVVIEEQFRLGAIAKVQAFAHAAGWQASEAVESPITGPAGNVEYLIHIQISQN